MTKIRKALVPPVKCQNKLSRRVEGVRGQQSVDQWTFIAGVESGNSQAIQYDGTSLPEMYRNITGISQLADADPARQVFLEYVNATLYLTNQGQETTEFTIYEMTPKDDFDWVDGLNNTPTAAWATGCDEQYTAIADAHVSATHTYDFGNTPTKYWAFNRAYKIRGTRRFILNGGQNKKFSYKMPINRNIRVSDWKSSTGGSELGAATYQLRRFTRNFMIIAKSFPVNDKTDKSLVDTCFTAYDVVWDISYSGRHIDKNLSNLTNFTPLKNNVPGPSVTFEPSGIPDADGMVTDMTAA